MIVIGAGPGGYTAAFRAADLGLRDDPRRAPRAPRRRVPERRLHPVEGAAARRAGDGRGRGDGRARHPLRRTRGRPRGAAGLEGRRRRPAHRRPQPVSPAPAQGRGRARRGAVHRPALAALLASGSSRSDTRSSPSAPTRFDCRRCPRTRGCSTPPAALSPDSIPDRLLVIGGGIIGLEMATVYDALGARVTVVELLDELIPGCDPDLVRPLQKRIEGRYEAIHTGDRGRSRSAPPTMACRSDFERDDRALRRDPRRRRPPAERRADRRGRRRGRGRRARLHRRRRAGCGRTSPGSQPSATCVAARCSPTRRATRARSRPR